MTKNLKPIADNLWKILLCTVLYASGLVASRLVFLALGITPPRMTAQADDVSFS